jgi:hypothetical protein
MFSHSLEVEELMAEHEVSPAAIKEMQARFARFRDKHKLDPRYLLFSPEAIEVGRFAEALAIATGAVAVKIALTSRATAARNEEEERRLYRIAKAGSLAKALQEPACALYERKEYNERPLSDIISSTLGKWGLIEVLEEGFGRSFTAIFQKDILKLWNCYVCALLHKKEDKAAIYGRLIDFYPKTMLIGRVAGEDGAPDTWHSFVA